MSDNKVVNLMAFVTRAHARKMTTRPDSRLEEVRMGADEEVLRVIDAMDRLGFLRIDGPRIAQVQPTTI